MTGSKFSAQLTSIVTDKRQISPEERIDVKVFLEEAAVLEKVVAELEIKGLKIKSIEEGPNVMVTGNIAVKDITGINAVAEVDRVEYDRGSEI